MTTTPNQQLPSQRVGLLAGQMAHHIDIYKHHFDFFLKAVGLYLTLTGGLAWAIFAADVESHWKAGAAAVSAATALLASYGSYFSLRWVKSVERDVGEICSELNLKPIVFEGAKDTIRMAMLFKLLILVVSLFCAGAFTLR